MPTPLPAQLTNSTANADANLRSGPGTNYEIIGSTSRGQTLDIVARNGAGDWYQLESGAWIAGFLVDNAPVDLQIASPETTTSSTSAPTATAIPIPSPTRDTRQASLESILLNVLIRSNRDVQRLSKVNIALDVITIKWSINDNLTENLIKSSARLDINDMLKALDNSGIEFGIVSFEGTFSLVDAFGNTSEEVVVWATYTDETVKQINWDGFIFRNVYSIADSYKLHRVFQD